MRYKLGNTETRDLAFLKADKGAREGLVLCPSLNVYMSKWHDSYSNSSPNCRRISESKLCGFKTDSSSRTNNTITTAAMSLPADGTSVMVPFRSTASSEGVVATGPHIITEETPLSQTGLSSPRPAFPYENPITQLNTISRWKDLTAVYGPKPCGPRNREWLCTLTLSPKRPTHAITIKLETPPEKPFGTIKAAKAFLAREALKILDVRILTISIFISFTISNETLACARCRVDISRGTGYGGHDLGFCGISGDWRMLGVAIEE
jgi:hypothetical protein